jgi:hypothetical protein
MTLRLLMARTIERWRKTYANWPASVASPARERSSYSLRSVTSAELIISSVEHNEEIVIREKRPTKRLPDLFTRRHGSF